MRLAIRFALFALCLRAAVAQAPPDVAEILKKVGERYRAAKQYEFVGDVTIHGAAPGTTPYHLLFAFEAPNRYRIEGGIPLTDSASDVDFHTGIIINDGSVVWSYYPKSNKYGALPASAMNFDDANERGAVADFRMSLYRGAADLSGQAKFLREEAIEFAGAKVDCYVLTVAPNEDSYAWWIDKRRHRILRQDSVEGDLVFTNIKLDEPLPNELFQFKPPPGARKIELNHH